MASTQEIAHQQDLLKTYRGNLALYLKQKALIGAAHVSPGVMNGITEERDNIQRVKQILRGWNIAVENLPDDGDAPVAQAPATQSSTAAPAIDRVALRNILVNNFNDEELHDLFFEMGENYEDLSGSNRSAKAREMVAFAERRGRTGELMNLIRRLRPHVMLT